MFSHRDRNLVARTYTIVTHTVIGLKSHEGEYECVCVCLTQLMFCFQPKCGFLPSPKHVSKDIKTKVCRYCMHQHYKVSTKTQHSYRTA